MPNPAGPGIKDSSTSTNGEKSKNGTDVRVKLDVPSAKAQQRRKQALVERMLKDGKPPKTFRLEASSLLSRVKDFLPQIEQANKKLESMSKDEVAEVVVENVPEDSESYVEMNLCMYSDGEDSGAADALGDLLDANCELKTSRETTLPLVEVVDKDENTS